MAPCGVDPLFFDLLVALALALGLALALALAMAMALALAAFYLKGVSPPRLGA